MAVILKGFAVSWGVGNITCTGIAIDPSTGKLQSVNFNREADEEPLLDENGETAGLAFYNLRKTVSITVVPASTTTIAAAKANLVTMLPSPGTQVNVADSTGSSPVDATWAGAYVCRSSSMGATNRGPATITMELVQFEAYDVKDTIS